MNENERKLLKSFLFFSVLLLGMLLLIYRKLILPQKNCLVKINKDISVLEKDLKTLAAEEDFLKSETKKIAELKKLVSKADCQLVKIDNIKDFPELLNKACKKSEFDISKVTYSSLSHRKDVQDHMDLNLLFESDLNSLKKFIDYFVDHNMPVVVKKISYKSMGEKVCKGSLMVRVFFKSANELFAD